MNVFDMVRSGSLVWFDGYGYVHPVPRHNYGSEYFHEYESRSKNEVSESLMDSRRALVDAYHEGDVVDVGSGFGTFVEHRNRGREEPNTFGYDVNPWSVAKTINLGLFWDPWERPMPAATFWDSLEHFDDPTPILSRIERYAFVSIPIFRSLEHVKESKHFKPGEHVWYFTSDGLVRFFKDHGFALIESSNREVVIGREDIESFVFVREVIGGMREGATC